MSLRFTTIAHRDHGVMSPLSSATVEALIADLALPEGGSILDVGCGNGAMLLRAVERSACGRAVGIDRNPAMIERATAATSRLPESRRGTIQWRCGEGRAVLDEGVRFDAVLCVGATGIFGGFEGTLTALRSLLAPGGRALVGEGYWRGEPATEYLDALGAARDEMTDFAETLERAQQAGFTLLAAHESSRDEWDVYEGLYAASMKRWCRENPDDPDTASFLARINAWGDAYVRWGRETLGFASVVVGE